MLIAQDELLHESVSYDDRLNQWRRSDMGPSWFLRHRYFLCNEPTSFRLAEGFIVMMRKAGVEAFFDWDSGYYTDEAKSGIARDLKTRIAASDVFILIVTEQAIHSEYCLKALKFASLINRRIYVVNTSDGKQAYRLPNDADYHQLTISRSVGIPPRYLVRVKDQHHEQLWRNVKNSSQL
jgi:hypothetical protein